MRIVHTPSPNHVSREGQKVDMLVMHYTGMESAAASLERLADPTPGNRVSAHYLVDVDGTVHALVPEERTAWHAGISSWRGQENINARSIGIEIQNTGSENYTPAQIEAVAELSRGIITRHNIPSWNVVGHSDIAPARKQDPGPRFPWQALAEQGIGAWENSPAPELFSDPVGWVKRLLGFNESVTLQEGDTGPGVLGMQKKLQAFGYGVPLCATFGEDTRKVVTAFQQHYRPERITGAWDAGCDALLNGLLARVPFSVKQGVARSA